MSKKKNENRLEESILAVEKILALLREEYSLKPSKPLYSILIAQETSLREMRELSKETQRVGQVES